MATTLHPPRSLLLRELVVPTLAVVATVVLPLVAWSTLPDPVAIHWGLDGRPDGSAPLVVDVVLMALMTALVTLLPLVAVARADRGTARTMLALSHGMGAFLVLLRWRTLELNRGATVWSDAGSLSLLDIAALLVVAAPLALLGWWLGGRHPDLPRPVREVMPLALPADGQLVWVGRQAWPVARLLGPALIASGALVTAVRVAAETLVLGVTLLVVGILLWWFTSITVAAGPAGLRVRFGPLGLPVIRVPLASIERIEVTDVEPLAFGGWGYRVMPGVRAVVIRRGVGLRVARSGRPDLVVTVDDAATAAGVLAAHRAAHRDAVGSAGDSD
jgi:hypothetical protein